MTAEPVIDALLAMDARDDSDRGVLPALAAYAERAIEAADGTWPPHVRASLYREALMNVAIECRRESTTTTEDEAPCQPR